MSVPHHAVAGPAHRGMEARKALTQPATVHGPAAAEVKPGRHRVGGFRTRTALPAGDARLLPALCLDHHGNTSNQMLMVAVEGWTGLGSRDWTHSCHGSLVVADRVNRRALWPSVWSCNLVAAGMLAVASYQFERDAGTAVSFPRNCCRGICCCRVSAAGRVARAFQIASPAGVDRPAGTGPQLLPRAMAFSASEPAGAAVIARPAVVVA